MNRVNVSGTNGDKALKIILFILLALILIGVIIFIFGKVEKSVSGNAIIDPAIPCIYSNPHCAAGTSCKLALGVFDNLIGYCCPDNRCAVSISTLANTIGCASDGLPLTYQNQAKKCFDGSWCDLSTCSSLGKNCGSWSDGCGGTLNCGTCSSGLTCNNGVCGTSATVCSDTDANVTFPNGANYLLRGTASNGSLLSPSNEPDYCDGNGHLIEHYCNGNVVKWGGIICQGYGPNYVCSEGACVNTCTVSKNYCYNSSHYKVCTSSGTFSNPAPCTVALGGTACNIHLDGYGYCEGVVADRCTNTDGGANLNVKGSISGYSNGQAFFYEDDCTGLRMLLERDCVGTAPSSSLKDCLGADYVCSQGACVPSGIPVTPTAGLVLHYKFDSITTGVGTQVSSLVDDFSGNGFSGRIYGIVSMISGKVDNAFKFDGRTGYINSTNSNLISVNNQIKNLSISFWYNATGTNTSYQGLVVKTDSFSTGTDYGFTTQDGYLVFASGESNCNMTVSEGARNQWHHVVGIIIPSTANTGTKKLYLDGVLIKTCSYTAKASSSRPLTIGVYSAPLSSPPKNFFFNGSIDDFRIYNRTLSQNEVSALAGVVPVVGTCTDTDMDSTHTNGANDLVKGTAFNGSIVSPSNEPDYCDGYGNLVEHYCSGSNVAWGVVNCTFSFGSGYVCSDGACVNLSSPPSNVAQTCAPTSTGKPRVPFGTRVTISNQKKYCNPESGEYVALKANNASCNNDFECLSNVCIDGNCTSIGETLRQQRSMLRQIWCLLTNFGSYISTAKTSYNACVQG